MIRYNTRFVPTVNGPLHLGHIVTILINQAEAHRTGGKFVLRMDDTTDSWNYKLGRSMVEFYKDVMREDLDWLGIRPDVWTAQSAMMAQAADFAKYRDIPLAEQPFGDYPGCEVVGDPTSYYPYAERFAQEHVLMDYFDGVNWVVRGRDLITENSLYLAYCRKYTLPMPRMTYLPRLSFQGQNVSKTDGRYPIASFREAGVSPSNLLNLLRADCLQVPYVGWLIENLKPQLELGSWAYELTDGIYRR